MDPSQPLQNLEWVFGLTSDTNVGVIDLRTDESNDRIAYVSGHTIVLHDTSQHKQVFLQGHVHEIQCFVACPKKKFIASADCGPDAILIVWNTENGQVHSSIPQNETGGIISLDFTSDGDRFVTLSVMGKNRKQKLCIWDIDSIECKLTVNFSVFSTDPQTCLRLNKDDRDEFVTNGKEAVFFWRLFKDKGSEIHTISREEANSKTADVQQNMPELSLSCFVPCSDTAITATLSGDVVVWKEQRSATAKELPKATSCFGLKVDSKKRSSVRQMHALKIVRLHQSAITHLSIHENYIVTGGADGYVRFYDHRIGLVGWFEELHAGGVMSVSFSRIDNFIEEEIPLNLRVPPFLVATKTGRIIFLNAVTFEEQPGTQTLKGKETIDYVPKGICSVSAHPCLPQFAIINVEGCLQVCDYNLRRICTQREFSKLKAEVIAYSPSGSVIACGFANGLLKIVESDVLHDIESIAVSRTRINKLVFSNDESYLAVADASFAVSLLSCTICKEHIEDKWKYIGKFRSHAKTIIGLHFTNDKDGCNRLFSVGHDCMIVEYDLLNSTEEKALKLKGTWPLNTSGVPTAMISINGFRGELYVLISDSDFKIRVYDTETFACHKTFLGPTFGTPMKSMHRIFSKDTSKDYLAFSTEDQIVGIMVLQLARNKNIQYLGVIGHAGSIKDITLSHHHTFLLTVGVRDSLNLWRISLPLLEKHFANEVDPILTHFSGAYGASSLQLLKQWFFTSQICSQGVDFPDERILDTSLKIDQVQNLLCALGIFPSISEMKEILMEISSSGERITFKDFLAVFINYRPIMDLDASLIQHAFSALGSDPRTGRLKLEQLLHILQTEGEQMTRDEIQHCFSTIMHVKVEALPIEVNAAWFSNELMNL